MRLNVSSTCGKAAPVRLIPPVVALAARPLQPAPEVVAREQVPEHPAVLREPQVPAAAPLEAVPPGTRVAAGLPGPAVA